MHRLGRGDAQTTRSILLLRRPECQLKDLPVTLGKVV